MDVPTNYLDDGASASRAAAAGASPGVGPESAAAPARPASSRRARVPRAARRRRRFAGAERRRASVMVAQSPRDGCAPPNTRPRSAASLVRRHASRDRRAWRRGLRAPPRKPSSSSCCCEIDLPRTCAAPRVSFCVPSILLLRRFRTRRVAAAVGLSCPPLRISFCHTILFLSRLLAHPSRLGVLSDVR